VWTGTAGSTILGPDERNADVLIGMAVGGWHARGHRWQCADRFRWL